MYVYAIRLENGPYFCRNSTNKDSSDYDLTKLHPKLFTSKKAVRRWAEKRSDVFRRYTGIGIDAFEVVEFDHENSCVVQPLDEFMQCSEVFVDCNGVRLECGQRVVVAENNHLNVGTIVHIDENYIDYCSNGARICVKKPRENNGSIMVL